MKRLFSVLILGAVVLAGFSVSANSLEVDHKEERKIQGPEEYYGQPLMRNLNPQPEEYNGQTLLRNFNPQPEEYNGQPTLRRFIK